MNSARVWDLGPSALRRLLVLALIPAAAVVFSACGGSSTAGWSDILTLGSEETYARVVSNELTVGRNRFVFGLLDGNGQPITDAKVLVRFFNLDESKTDPMIEVAASQIYTEGAVPEYEAVRLPGHIPRAGQLGRRIRDRSRRRGYGGRTLSLFGQGEVPDPRCRRSGAAVILIALPAAPDVCDGTSKKLRAGARRFLAWAMLPAAALLLTVGAAELWLQARQFGGIEEINRVLETEWGERWLWRQALLGVTAVGLAGALVLGRRSDKSSGLLWLAFAASLASLLFVSLVSHANAAARGSFWATASDFIHLTTAATWIGGLVAVAALLVWARRELSSEERAVLLAGALRRFSLLATTSLALLLATGVFNALVQVSSWPEMVETPYGRALTVKLILIVPLLGVAALNAFVLRPNFIRRAAGDSGGAERLRAWLGCAVPLEAALAIAVLAVVGLLTQYTPARTETEAAAQTALTAAAPMGERDAYGFPLVAGSWSWVAAGILVVAAILAWVWAGYVRLALRAVRVVGRGAAMTLAAIGGIVVLSSLTTADTAPAFEAAVGFRYQASDGRLVLLEITPFEVGANTFRVTVMNEEEEFLEADNVKLSLSRLEREGTASEVPMRPSSGGRPAYLGEFALEETGWWAVEAVVDNQASASFYLRLDNPSLAPLEFAPPDYESDPKAEQIFREALERYESQRRKVVHAQGAGGDRRGRQGPRSGGRCWHRRELPLLRRTRRGHHCHGAGSLHAS